MPHRAPAGVLAAMLAVLVGACSPQPDTAETAGPSVSPTTRTAAQGPRPPGPLFSYLQQVGADGEADRVEREKRVEELVAACMADEGFEYWPREPSPEWDEWEQFTLEYAQQYGYGSSTTGPTPGHDRARRPERGVPGVAVVERPDRVRRGDVGLQRPGEPRRVRRGRADHRVPGRAVGGGPGVRRAARAVRDLAVRDAGGPPDDRGGHRVVRVHGGRRVRRGHAERRPGEPVGRQLGRDHHPGGPEAGRSTPRSPTSRVRSRPTTRPRCSRRSTSWSRSSSTPTASSWKHWWRRTPSTRADQPCGSSARSSTSSRARYSVSSISPRA